MPAVFQYFVNNYFHTKKKCTRKLLWNFELLFTMTKYIAKGRDILFVKNGSLFLLLAKISFSSYTGSIVLRNDFHPYSVHTCNGTHGCYVHAWGKCQRFLFYPDALLHTQKRQPSIVQLRSLFFFFRIFLRLLNVKHKLSYRTWSNLPSQPSEKIFWRYHLSIALYHPESCV